MRFISTRGQTTEPKTFEESLFCCYTEDGGVLMPETIPKVDLMTLQKWKNLNYIALVKEIVSFYVSSDEVTLQDQSDLIDAAFSSFDIDEVIQLAKLENGLNILELWHGKTLAFKDLAMSCTAQFINYFLSKRGRHFTAVVVTSGDTGSSAIHNALDLPCIDIIVIFPHKRISKFQERMMTTVLAKNIHVYAADGSNDDIENTVINVMNDGELVKKHPLLGTLNSQNWCRILVQESIAHSVYAYLHATERVGAPVDIIIPCGGYGNMASCLIAKEMGVPINPVSVSNANDFMYRVVKTNELVLSKVQATIAPAMDIGFPLNSERVFWLLSGGNGQLIRELMEKFIETGHANLPADLHTKLVKTVETSVASESAIIEAIQRCWKESNYPICPHTATAVAHYYGLTEGYKESENPAVHLATASAAKFSEALTKAGIPLQRSPKIDVLEKKKSQYTMLAKGDNWKKILREKIVEISCRANR
uniref:Threonine synthase-like 2 n=1 Tax=Ciona savignyi TaxID=51511 RepID=H2YG53_CIOSA